MNNLNATAFVQTNYGRIKGILTLSLLNNIFYSFYGVPYAKPPLGELRFKVSLAKYKLDLSFLFFEIDEKHLYNNSFLGSADPATVARYLGCNQ